MGMTTITLAKELRFAEVAGMRLGAHVISDSRCPDGLRPLRCHKSKISQTGRLDNASVVKREMLSLLHNLKILWAIVILNAIYVMNNFALRYRTPNGSRRYKDVLSNVASLVSVWMIRRSNKHIAVSRLVPAAFESRVCFATP